MKMTMGKCCSIRWGYNRFCFTGGKGRCREIISGTLIKKLFASFLFRTSNHRLPIETGRWENLPLNESKCHVYTKNDIGDEYHYLFCCCYFMSERKRLFKPTFYRNQIILKFRNLLSSNNVSTLKRLYEFTRIIMAKFTS